MPGTRFSVDFDEVSELIPNIPSNAPSLLIERYCKYLKKFIDHRIFSGTRRICIDSIYKWLARVPGPATKILGYGDKEAVDKIDDILLDFEVSVDLSSISTI
ncbi:hypothetical protein RF11_03661 [Thelohanellus kitauei]|uniref:Uncharacterized protein n=1 Tax=Thelohanellus kitauei TaxID=669202 RepID=A0A0C2N7V0_THEKT|nr:hypothetical protein RF11_03661 [Thelohanellus kitauei]